MELPYLPYPKWTQTRMTLHLILQIIGKIRLKLTPRKNHWWYITLYVAPEGFSTGAIPMNDGLDVFSITFHVRERAVVVGNSRGDQRNLPLADGATVADFYAEIMFLMLSWGLEPDFVNRPMDLGIDKPFDQITEYHHYDWEAIETFWRMMLWTDGVFKEFSGRFYGKTCPVHIYWHHMDLAVTRFSGREAPAMDPQARISDKDAYSHEVISFGFWAGDENVPEPAFYSYTAPAPEGLDQEPLEPSGAFWTDANGSPMALLRYEALLSVENPRTSLLDFLESAYRAGARRAGWDIDGLRVKPLDRL